MKYSKNTNFKTLIIVSECQTKLGENFSVAMYIFEAHSDLNSGSAVSKNIIISFDIFVIFVLLIKAKHNSSARLKLYM